MPLKEGKSKEAFSYNVSELIKSWRKHKKIDTSHPKSFSKARKQALAIAFSKQGK
jgi:hypothetical protein